MAEALKPRRLTSSVEVGEFLYRINDVLVYRGHSEGREIDLLEYAPLGAAIRRDGAIAPRTRDLAAVFHKGRDAFSGQTERLASFHYPNVVPVLGGFSAGGTVWRIEEPAGPPPLMQERRTPEEVMRFVRDVARGLLAAQAHSEPLNHFGIAPDALSDEDGRILLRAFRVDPRPYIKQAGKEVLTWPGYAAMELNDPTASEPLAAATDIYGLGALAHHLVMGAPPAPWNLRKDGPIDWSARPVDYPSGFLEAVEQALRIEPEDRLKTLSGLIVPERILPARTSGRSRIEPSIPEPSPVEPVPSEAAAVEIPVPQPLPSPPEPARPTPAPAPAVVSAPMRALIGLICGVVVILGGVGLGYATGMFSAFDWREAPEAQVPAEAIPTSPKGCRWSGDPSQLFCGSGDGQLIRGHGLTPELVDQANAGDAAAMLQLAEFLAMPTPAQDPVEAGRLIQRAARTGEVSAMLAYAATLANPAPGAGAVPNPTDGRGWYLAVLADADNPAVPGLPTPRTPTDAQRRAARDAAMALDPAVMSGGWEFGAGNRLTCTPLSWTADQLEFGDLGGSVVTASREPGLVAIIDEKTLYRVVFRLDAEGRELTVRYLDPQTQEQLGEERYPRCAQ